MAVSTTTDWRKRIQTRDEFFSTVKENLQELLRNKRFCVMPKGTDGGFWSWAMQQTNFLRFFACLTTVDCEVITEQEKRTTFPDENLMVLDVRTSKNYPFGFYQNLRVFAYYVDFENEDFKNRNSLDAYNHAKAKIKAAYDRFKQTRSERVDKFQLGAAVIAANKPWNFDEKFAGLNTEGLPPKVALQVLAPSDKKNLDVEQRSIYVRALEPERFDERKERVKAAIKASSWGTVKSNDVSEATGIPQEDVRYIFDNLQADGGYMLANKGDAIVKSGDVKSVNKVWSQIRGAWYTRQSSNIIDSVSVLISILVACVVNMIPNLITEQMWFWAIFVTLLIAYFVVRGVKVGFRPRRIRIRR